jgi:hypothetical protein
MMIAEHSLTDLAPRARRAPTGSRAPAVGGFVFAVAALPGEAEGFRWPSWLSPIARTQLDGSLSPSSSKRSR